jgi:hypothetical protein
MTRKGLAVYGNQRRDQVVKLLDLVMVQIHWIKLLELRKA